MHLSARGDPVEVPSSQASEEGASAFAEPDPIEEAGGAFAPGDATPTGDGPDGGPADTREAERPEEGELECNSPQSTICECEEGESEGGWGEGQFRFNLGYGVDEDGNCRVRSPRS
eukprot:13838169-Alexandrium_andersonii.AAC.1